MVGNTAAPIIFNDVNVNGSRDTLHMLQSPYEKFQENLRHLGYDYPFLVITGLMEVLEKLFHMSSS